MFMVLGVCDLLFRFFEGIGFGIWGLEFRCRIKGGATGYRTLPLQFIVRMINKQMEEKLDNEMEAGFTQGF